MNQKLSMLGRAVGNVANVLQDATLAALVSFPLWLIVNQQHGRAMLFWLDRWRPPNWPGLEGLAEIGRYAAQSVALLELVQLASFFCFAYLAASSIFNRKKKGAL